MWGLFISPLQPVTWRRGCRSRERSGVPIDAGCLGLHLDPVRHGRTRTDDSVRFATPLLPKTGGNLPRQPPFAPVIRAVRPQRLAPSTTTPPAWRACQNYRSCESDQTVAIGIADQKKMVSWSATCEGAKRNTKRFIGSRTGWQFSGVLNRAASVTVPRQFPPAPVMILARRTTRLPRGGSTLA